MTHLLKKIGVALFSATLVVGCDASGTAAGLSFLETPNAAPTPVITSSRLANGQVTVSGPDGYCIDATTLRRTQAGGFAAIASCNILSNGETGPIVEPVLVTVTVGRATSDAPSLEDLANALGTGVSQTRELSAVTAGRLANGGQTAFEGSDPRHWRGTFVLGGRMVGLALYAPQGSPFIGAQGAAFLNTVSSRIRARSQAVQRSAEQSQTATDPVAAQLGRLFGRRDL